MIFLGDETGIVCNALPERIASADKALGVCLDRLGTVERFVSFAWEDGDEDHDAACWLAARHARQLGVLAESRVFPFYRASLRRFPFYTMFEPLTENGLVEERRIPWASRLRYITLCLRYPSQITTFIGLLPLFIRHYLWRGTQQTQPLLESRLGQLPHLGEPLYQLRGRAHFDDVIRYLRHVS